MIEKNKMPKVILIIREISKMEFYSEMAKLEKK